MSTKVYVAYKVRPHIAKDPSQFWGWVRGTIARGEKEVQKVIRALYAELAAKVLIDSEAYKKHLGKETDGYLPRLSFAHRTVMHEFTKQESNPRRNLFDLGVEIAIRELDGGLYVIPHCDMLASNTLDFLKKDKALVDFCYWNNTDPPEGMTRRRWEARGKVWDAINDRGWRDYLLMTICDPSKFVYIDPWIDMVNEHNRKLKKEAAHA